MSFTDKVVLVTGASRGIGAAIAERFVREGAYVIGTATTEKGAENFTKSVEGLGGKGQGMVLNLSDEASIAAFTEALSSLSTPVQILVNNAGITADNLMLRMKADEWNSVIQTNLSGVFFLTQALLKTMLKARFGRIISIGSVVGVSGNPGQANYCAAKAGLIGFSKSLAKEVASRNITVNVVAPGFIETDMTVGGLNDTQKAQILGQIPMDRMGTPADIAHAVLFLASDSANYITGETIHVNGGMYMQ